MDGKKVGGATDGINLVTINLHNAPIWYKIARVCRYIIAVSNNLSTQCILSMVLQIPLPLFLPCSVSSLLSKDQEEAIDVQ